MANHPTLKGGTFNWDKIVAELRARGARDPEALAAWIGRRVMGKAAFEQLSKNARRG
ncbi:hypothetical protein [Streptomyces sp. NPDC017941]|uniref:hypothetical protein n=1 Tax=Streptomyces sp. NPDC017941 TaxID=3365018 RepID=UPI00378B7B99